MTTLTTNSQIISRRYVRKEFENFCAVTDENSRGANRGRNLPKLLSLLGVYANAGKVILAHGPSK